MQVIAKVVDIYDYKSRVGGIVGWFYTNANFNQIINCINTSILEGDETTGGIMGQRE